jgi:hypothetical protein
MKRDAAIASGIYVYCLAGASLFWQRPMVVLVLYVALSAFMLYRWHSRSDVAAFVTAMVLGSVADFVAVSFGVWEYGQPIYRVPIWLPLGWGIIGLFLKRVSDMLISAKQRTGPR